METAYSRNNTMSAHSQPSSTRLSQVTSHAVRIGTGSAKVLSLNPPPEMSYEVEGAPAVRQVVRRAFGLGTHALMCRKVHRK